jgi:hypothetical protein
MVVLGQHVPSLSWLKILLAEQSEMEPWLQYYQRLLSKDPHEAGLLLKKHAENSTPAKTYDQIVVPALNWTRLERQTGDIDAEEVNYVWATTRQLLNEIAARRSDPSAARLARNDGNETGDTDATIGQQLLTGEPIAPTAPVADILGYPAHHESEELALTMLGQMLPDDFKLEIASTHSLPNQILKTIESHRPIAVVIAVLPPGGLPQVEFFCEQCRERSPQTQIVVVHLGEVDDFDKLLVDLRRVGASYLTTSLEQTTNQLRSIVDAWRDGMLRTLHPNTDSQVAPPNFIKPTIAQVSS